LYNDFRKIKYQSATVYNLLLNYHRNPKNARGLMVVSRNFRQGGEAVGITGGNHALGLLMADGGVLDVNAHKPPPLH